MITWIHCLLLKLLYLYLMTEIKLSFYENKKQKAREVGVT